MQSALQTNACGEPQETEKEELKRELPADAGA